MLECKSSHDEASKTVISAEMKNDNTKKLDEGATVHLLKENGKKSNIILSTNVFERFVQLSKRTSDRTAIIS